MFNSDKFGRSIKQQKQDQIAATTGSLFKGLFVVWALWVCVALTLFGGMIYIAIHFASKYW